MVKRQSSTPEPRKVTELTLRKDEFKRVIEERISIGEKIYKRQIETQEEFDEAKNDYSIWNDFNSELLKQSFNEPFNEYRKAYDDSNRSLVYFLGGPSSPAEELIKFKKKVNSKVSSLIRLRNKIDLLKSSSKNNSTDIAKEQIPTEIATNDVFIVHGHNDKTKIEVARTLEKLGLNPIILHEQANSGKTIIEKFEKYANVGYAVILLTDDDLGKRKEEDDLSARARQNVILEMGYFLGKLGRDRVCTLYTPGVELPSDLSGILYTELDPKDSWKLRLVKELKAIGYDVDANLIL